MILIINLEKDHHKKSYITNELHTHGITDFEIIKAIDGSQLSQSDLENCYSIELNKKYYYRQLSQGEIGCALSHLLCYQKIIDAEVSGAFIIEDDCKLNKDAKRNMDELVDLDLPKDALILLSYAAYYYRKKKLSLNQQYNLYKTYKAHMSSSYYITRQAALNMLLAFKKIYLPIDTWQELNTKKIIQLFNIVPYCATQKEMSISESSIGTVRFNKPRNRSQSCLSRAIFFLKPYLYPKRFLQILQSIFFGIQHQDKKENR